MRPLEMPPVRRQHAALATGGAPMRSSSQPPRWQDDGLEVLAVVVGSVVDSALLELGEQLDGDGGQLALGVAHRRSGVAV